MGLISCGHADSLVTLLLALMTLTSGCATSPAPGPAPAAPAPAAGDRPHWLTADAPARPLRILLTNDDGWDAPGLAAVREALVKAGHQLTVVAPAGDRSGTCPPTGPPGPPTHRHRRADRAGGGRAGPGRDGGPLLPPGMLLNINLPKADPARPVPVARYVASAPDLAITLGYRRGADPTRFTVAVGRPARAPSPDGDVAVVARGQAAITELRVDRTAAGTLSSVAADLAARLGP